MIDFLQEDLYTKCNSLLALLESSQVDYNITNISNQLLLLIKEQLGAGDEATKEIEDMGNVECKGFQAPDKPTTYRISIGKEGYSFWFIYIEHDTTRGVDIGCYNKYGNNIELHYDFKLSKDATLTRSDILHALDTCPDLHDALLHELGHALDDRQAKLNYGLQKEQLNFAKYYCSGNETNARFHAKFGTFIYDTMRKDMTVYPALLSREGFVFFRDYLCKQIFTKQAAIALDEMQDKRFEYKTPRTREKRFQSVADRIKDRVTNMLEEVRIHQRETMVDTLAEKFSAAIHRWRNNKPNLRLYIIHHIRSKIPKLAGITPPTDFVDEIIARGSK